MAHVIGAGDLRQRLAVGATTVRLALLVRGEFWPAAEFDAACLRAYASLTVRARISSRSNSAKPPRTGSIRRPCGVVVSAQASPGDLKPAPVAVMAASVLSRSRVLR